MINVFSMFYDLLIKHSFTKCDDQLTYNLTEHIVSRPTTDLHPELRVINYYGGLNSLNYCPALTYDLQQLASGCGSGCEIFEWCAHLHRSVRPGGAGVERGHSNDA